MAQIRTIIADDHPVVVHGICTRLAAVPGSRFVKVGHAASSDALLESLGQQRCDLLITDFCMPGREQPDGLGMLGYIRRHYPDVRILLMTMVNHPGTLHAALELGVKGLLDKRGCLSELPKAATQVAHGRRFISRNFERLLASHDVRGYAACLATLSPRELEVVRLIARGASGRDIAVQMNRSEKTVSRHKRSAMEKLGLDRGDQIREYARVTGLMG
jgi:two-component system capsular synthesis response regulator RcsB